MTLKVSRVAGGMRNVTLHCTGCIEHDLPLTPLDTGIVEGMKLTSLMWVIQEKMGLYLWWDKETLLMPLESRNSVRFDTGISAPYGWDGKMYLSSYLCNTPPSPMKAFLLVLDFDR
jgi:hypothetical protein